VRGQATGQGSYPEDVHDADRAVPMVRLTQVHGSFAARVLLARLTDEGIDARLRGSVDSPYRFTIGDMARVEVYVPEDQIDDAAYVMLANEVEDATTLPEAAIRVSLRHRGVAALVLAAIVIAAIAPVVRYAGG
jgi:hypothetical protein